MKFFTREICVCAHLTQTRDAQRACAEMGIIMKKNIIVGQSGGPTAAINASLAGVYQAARDAGFGVYGMRYGIEGLLQGKYVDLSEHIKNDLDKELLLRTPSSYLGSCRYKLPEAEAGSEIYEQIFALLEKQNIFAFFYIGGNDSMDTIKKLSDYAALCGSKILFVGVPKTIDNDLACTDHTPGFGSAAKYIAATTREVIRDGLVYDIPSVTILEIMGRNAGWLTAAASLAKGADCEGVDMLFLPEIPFDLDSFFGQVKALMQNRKSLVIAVSEGIRLKDGRFVCELTSDSNAVDAFGHKMMQGAGKYLADFLHASLGIKTRAIELNTPQRCAAHFSSRTDITESYNAGTAAVKAALEGKSGIVITLERTSTVPYLCTTSCQDVHKIANVEKKVPVEWIDTENFSVTEEALAYLRPLIQGEMSPIIINGLPGHLYLQA